MKFKKITTAAVSAALTFSLLGGMYSECNRDLFIVKAQESIVIGDANQDGNLNIRDAAFIARKLAERKKDELPLSADYNGDGELNIRDAASIARFLANRSSQVNQIKFRFADKAEGITLRLENDDYFNNLSQQDLNYRMQKTDASLEEFKEFSKAQILDFTDEQKDLITETIAYIQNVLNKNGYNLPLNEEIIFINTTAADEQGASGYTLKNQIYLADAMVNDGYSSLLKKIIVHEIFHCLTRSNPQFREDMYKLIGFTVEDDEPEFPQEVKDVLISNPDVKYDSHAVFTINGEKRDCYMVWYIKKPFENADDNLFLMSATGLIPTDDLSTIYNIDDASDFWDVVGKNTEYVTAAEECLADNFAFAVLFGTNGMTYKSPEIIKNMVEYMKSYR